MTVFVKKYQNNNRKNESAFGKWYGRAVVIDKVEIEELADEIQDNCTVKRSDILAVLSEMGPAIKKMVQKSIKVTIPYLGSFKLGVKSMGVDEADDYDTKKHVKGLHVIFHPETKKEQGRMVKELTRGARVAEVPKNLAYLTDEDDETGGNQGGNQDTTANDEP